MKFVKSGQLLGARVDDIDLSQTLSEDDFKQLEQALGKYSVLSYPKDQCLRRGRPIIGHFLQISYEFSPLIQC